MGPNPGGFGSNWAAIKTPYVIVSSTCHLAHTYPNSTKKFEMQEKNENLSPHLNTQYFAAASNDFQFPSTELVKTWIINDDVFGPVIRRNLESEADSWLRRIGPNASFH